MVLALCHYFLSTLQGTIRDKSSLIADLLGPSYFGVVFFVPCPRDVEVSFLFSELTIYPFLALF
jgi:hypothetical protein